MSAGFSMSLARGATIKTSPLHQRAEADQLASDTLGRYGQNVKKKKKTGSG